MRAWSSLGLALSLVCSLIFLALLAELYYLLIRKRKKPSAAMAAAIGGSNREINGLKSASFDHFLCFVDDHPSVPQLSAGIPGLAAVDQQGSEDGADAEFMRLHGFAGPSSRLLFTIQEETKEDLESDTGRRTRVSRSLGDLMFHHVETPSLLSPLPSPPLRGSYGHLEFNPLFDYSSGGAGTAPEASPPPKFKFLKDAEEKLHRRALFEEDTLRAQKVGNDAMAVTVGKNRVIPLPSLLAKAGHRLLSP